MPCLPLFPRWFRVRKISTVFAFLGPRFAPINVSPHTHMRSFTRLNIPIVDASGGSRTPIRFGQSLSSIEPRLYQVYEHILPDSKPSCRSNVYSLKIELNHRAPKLLLAPRYPDLAPRPPSPRLRGSCHLVPQTHSGPPQDVAAETRARKKK